MLDDLLYQFQHHEVDGHMFDIDTMVLESYRLKPGLYIRLNNDDTMNELYVDKKGNCNNEQLHPWFAKMDFTSCLIEMNKSVDPKKKIHSNNIYTMFCKLNNFINNGAVNPNLASDIERYYSEFRAFKDVKAKEILTAAGYTLLEEAKISNCKDRMIAVLTSTSALVMKYAIKDNCYIKLFLDADEAAYTYEGSRYLLPKIFNCNDYNLEYNGKVLGLSNSNMGMNAKKPFLEHKSTAFKVPFRISAEDAVTLRKLFLWLGSQKREEKAVSSGYIPVDRHLPELLVEADKLFQRQSVNYVHFENGMDVTIDDYDFLPRYCDKLDEPVQFKNYLEVKGFSGGNKVLLSEVEEIINRYFFNYKLVYNYYTSSVRAGKDLSHELAEQIMLTRDVWHAWFRKGNPVLLTAEIVNKLTMQIILAQLQDLNYLNTIAYSLNIRFALLKYFNKEDQDMGNQVANAYNALKDKVINQKRNAFCESRMEFYLAAGQILKYLFSLSKAQKICYDVLLRSVTSAKTPSGLKAQIQQFFRKYAYDIECTRSYSRYDKMLTIVNSYIPDNDDENIWVDMLLCGFATDSIIYYKNKEDKENEKE